MAMLLQIWFHLIVHSKGVIQQLRGLNFTQLYSLPSLEWTIVDILPNTYPSSLTWPSVDFQLTPSPLFLSTLLMNAP